MKLRNKTRQASRIGYLVKAVPGGFTYAGLNDTPIGVITEVVSSGAMCEIQTNGIAKVFTLRHVSEGDNLRMTVSNEGGQAGVAYPVGNAENYISVGTVVKSGKGLINVALNLASAGVVGDISAVPDGGTAGQVLTKVSGTDGDVYWATPSTGISDAPSDGTGYIRSDAGWVSSALLLDRSGGTGSQYDSVAYGEALSFATSGSGLSVNFSSSVVAGVLGNVTTKLFTFTFTPAGSYYDGWFIKADSGGSGGTDNVVSTARVDFKGGSNITTVLAYATPGGTPPVTADITINLDSNISLSSVTATASLTTPLLASSSGLAIRAASGNSITYYAASDVLNGSSLTQHWWRISNVTELYLNSSALYPNATLDIGRSSNYFTTGYVTTLNSQTINYSSGVAIQYNGDTRLQTVSSGIQTNGNISAYSLTETDTRLTINTSVNYVASIYYYDEGDTALQDILIGSTSIGTGIYWDASLSRVGVNDNTPSYTLDVNGTIRAQTAILSSGEVTSYASDGRLKTDILPIHGALDVMDSIHGVTFRWRDGVEELGFKPNSRREHGFIAQNVQAHFPEGVAPAPFDHDEDGNSISGEDYLTVKAEKLLPIHHEAIKELHARIKELERQLARY